MAQLGISVKSLVSSYETRMVGMVPGPPRKRGCVSSPCSPRGASPIRGASAPPPHRGLGVPGQLPSPRQGMDKTLLSLILYCHSGSGSLVGIDNKIEQAMVFFWKHKAKSTILEHHDSRKSALKVEKTPKVVETFKLAEPCEEAKVSKTEETAKVADPFTLAKSTEKAEVEKRCEGRSLLQLPRTAVKSVSMLMGSALQSGWQMCTWKSSVSSTSISSQMKSGSPLETPEAEMLREVYLVLWALRKQLRQLARRQERRRRHHIRTHAGPQPEAVQGLKQDARSPL
uniref:TSC22 domain family member 4 n=1 Tax=Canis lupus familiaris TaxID=9615 RepID=A0A8P0TFG9_CANLF